MAHNRVARHRLAELVLGAVAGLARLRLHQEGLIGTFAYGLQADVICVLARSLIFVAGQRLSILNQRQAALLRITSLPLAVVHIHTLE